MITTRTYDDTRDQAFADPSHIGFSGTTRIQFQRVLKSDGITLGRRFRAKPSVSVASCMFTVLRPISHGASKFPASGLVFEWNLTEALHRSIVRTMCKFSAPSGKVLMDSTRATRTCSVLSGACSPRVYRAQTVDLSEDILLRPIFRATVCFAGSNSA